VEEFTAEIFIETDQLPIGSGKQQDFAMVYIEKYNDVAAESCAQIIIEDVFDIDLVGSTGPSEPCEGPCTRRKLRKTGVTASVSGRCSGSGCSSKIPLQFTPRPRRRLKQGSEIVPPPLPKRKAGHRRGLAQEKRRAIGEEKASASDTSPIRSPPRQLQFSVDGTCLCPAGAGSDPSFESPSPEDFIMELNQALDKVGLGPVLSIIESKQVVITEPGSTETVYVPATVNQAICADSSLREDLASLFQETYDFLAFLTCDPLNRQIENINFTCEPSATCTGAGEVLGFFEVTVEGFGTFPEDALFGEVAESSGTRKLEFLQGSCSAEAPGSVAPCREAFLFDFAAGVTETSNDIQGPVALLLEPQCQCGSTTFVEEGVGVIATGTGPCEDRRKLTKDDPIESTVADTKPSARGSKLSRGLGGKGASESTCGLVGCNSGKGGGKGRSRKLTQNTRDLRGGKMDSSGLRCF
jgi:hypothetical protein